MFKISTKYVRPILEQMYESRSEMVPCFLGAPGIGKTQGLYEFAKDKGVNVVTFILSNTVPSEVSGIRIPDQETKAMEVFDDARMASLKDGDILFFDEILEAPMLWSACLTLIQDRLMASGRKMPDVFIVGASNYVASPGTIEASTRDRFQFIQLEFDWDHWSEWFADKYGVRPEPGLRKFIEEDSIQYNILTPRRVCKLFEWLKSGKREDEAFKQMVIDSMFEPAVSDLLACMVHNVPTPQEQVRRVLIDIPSINAEDLPEEMVNWPLPKILEHLQELEMWDDIQEALGSVELEVSETKRDWISL